LLRSPIESVYPSRCLDATGRPDLAPRTPRRPDGSLQSAADFLGLTPSALRKAIERRAVRAPDGGIEADLDGVRARKLGRLWRVQLGDRWGSPVPTTPMSVVGSTHRGSGRAGQERARRQGKHVGRPKAEVNLDQAIELRARGLSIRKAAEKLGVSSSVLHRALRTLEESVPKASLETGYSVR
jgi:DNA-binding NtrC family response regulator